MMSSSVTPRVDGGRRRPVATRKWSASLWLFTSLIAIALQVAHAGSLALVAPAGASPGVAINITGSGFHATAASNEVRFTPTVGAPLVASGTAISAPDSLGRRRLTVTVPTGLAAGPAALRVRNTATGESSEGRALDVLTLSLPNVAQAAPGATGVSVRVTGSPLVRFAAASRVSFGAGTTVTSTTIESPTSLLAVVSIASNAALGARDVTVMSSTQTARLADGFSVQAPAPNRLPVVSAGGPYAGLTGQPLSLLGTASDPDGDALTLAWDFGDGTPSVGGTTSPAHTYAQAGDFTVRLTANDGRGGVTSATALVHVTTANRAPTANPGGPYTGIVGGVVAFAGTASTDPDGDPLTYAWDFGDGATATGPVVSHAYASATSFTVKLTVGDGRGGVHQASTTATIENRPNAAPSFTSAPVTDAKHQLAYRYQAAATDGDGDALTFSLVNAPSGMAVGPQTGLVEWTPTGSQIGPHEITLVVTDAPGAAATQTFTIAVVDVTAPVVSLNLPTEAMPGTPVTATALAEDNVAVTEVSFEVNGAAPTSHAAPPFQRAITVPGTAVAGTEFHVRATARDAAGHASAMDKTFKVAAVPDTTPPAVTLQVPPQAAPGTIVRLTATAGDLVGVKSVTFKVGDTTIAADTEPPYATQYAVPGNAAVGSSLAFSARVLDTADNFAEATGSLQVVAAPDVTPPTVAIDTPDAVAEGGTLLMSATAADNVGVAKVTFYVNGVRTSTATSAPYRGSFRVPAHVAGGDILHVEARALDFAGLSASSATETHVLASPNRAPTASAGGPYSGQVGQRIQLTAAASSDPDPADHLTFDWDFGDDTTGSGLSPTHAYSAPGSFTAEVTVSDGRGGIATAQAIVTIAPATDQQPPNVTLNAPGVALPGTQITVTARATDDVGIAAVRFEVDGGTPTETATVPYQRTIDIPGVAAPGDTLVIAATARDAAGNEATDEVTLTIGAAPDTQPPTIALNAPPQVAAGTTLHLSASALDNVGVQTAVFSVNGQVIATVPAPPYETSYPVPADAADGLSLGVLVDVVDFSGNHSTATANVIVAAPTAADTVPPTVTLTAPLQVFAGKTLPLSAIAADNVGIAAVNFFVNGVNVATVTTPPYAITWPVPSQQASDAVLHLRATATDFSGLTATATAQTLVISTAAAGQGILLGEVYDDGTSRPLAGVTVTLAGVDAAGAPYAATTTTDARGQWLLRAAAGDGTIRLTRQGWTRVDRPATIVADRAHAVIDARLSLLGSASAAMSPVLGGAITAELGTLIVPPGAMPVAATVTLTAIGGQGLQGVLPAGWSPVAAADVTPHGLAFGSPAQLTFASSLAIAGGSPLLVAMWDEQVSMWRAVATVDGLPSQSLAFQIPASGQYVVLLADTVPAAPAWPIVGAPVLGVSSTPLAGDATAVVDPQPRILVYDPNVRSDVRGVVTTTSPTPSGVPMQARISEAYTFVGGSEARPQPVVEDLFFYQAGTAAPGVTGAFTVAPSLAFERLALQRGVITVELFTAPASPAAVTTIGVDGGTVTSGAGETLQVPQGATGQPLPMAVQPLAAASLGGALPTGVDYVGGALVSFSGSLTKAAVLSVAKPTSVTDASRLLLVRLQEIGGKTQLLLVGRARIVGNQIISDTTLGATADAFEGVRVAGRYVFVRASMPIGFARGSVLAGGSPLAAAVVSSASLPVVGLSGTTGRYITAAATGSVVLTALNLETADTGTGMGTLATAGAVVDIDLSMLASGPAVVSIVPADGATSVPLSSAAVIRFSKPIDLASVSGANSANLKLSGPGGVVATSLELTAENTVATIRPTSALTSNTLYTVAATAAITDRAGRPMSAPASAQFRTLDTAPPPAPTGGIRATIPGTNGLTTITGGPGSAGTHDTVTIVNLTRGTSTPVVQRNPDGSFTIHVQAGLGDKLQLVITGPNGTQTVVAIERFSQVNADGSISTAVDAAGGLLEGPGGTAVQVPQGAFPDGAVITIKKIAEAQFPVQLDAQSKQTFGFAGGIELDFGGRTPAQYVNIFVPAGPGDTADDQWLVSRVRQDNGAPVLDVVDTAKLVDGRVRTASPPCPGVTAAGVYGVYKSSQPVGVNYAQMYSSGYGGMRVRAEMLFGGGLAVFPLPYYVLEPTIDAPICYPVLTGRVTVVANSQRLTIPADALTPADREIVVKNIDAETELHFPRNVLEYTFDVDGLTSHSYSVIVRDTNNVDAALTGIKITTAGASTVTVHLDPDKITLAVAAVIVTNTSTGGVTTFYRPQIALRLPVSGGADDTYQVSVINAAGQLRQVAHGPFESPSGAHNMMARAVPGTIDPTQAEIDAYNAQHPDAPLAGPGRKRVLLHNDTRQTTVEVPAAVIVNGGFAFDFDGSLTDRYGLTVEYDNGQQAAINIPTFRITVTNRTTGRVIKTIVAPAPPRDQPLNLGVISDDAQPPILTSGPPRMNSFEPTGLLTFTFSEPMNADSLKLGIIVELVKNGVRTRVPGEIRVSNGNRTITFVPLTPLQLGEEYSISFVGDDALAAALALGGAPVTDRSGNAMATTRFKLTTFKPRTVGAFAAELDASQGPIDFKDIQIRRTRVDNAPKTYVIGTTDSRSPAYRLITLDVTDPANPTKTATTAGGNGKKRLLLLPDIGTPGHPPMSVRHDPPTTVAQKCDGSTIQAFTGDLGITTSWTTYFSYLTFFDVSDAANPCVLANRVLTANPEALTDFSRNGTVHALGFPRGLATVQHAQGYAAYAAVGEVGLFATDIGQNIPERVPAERIKEGMHPGDYWDVVNVSDKLLAANRGDSRLDLFDPNLTRLGSIELSARPRRIVTVEGYGVDQDDDGVVAADEVFDLALVAIDDPATRLYKIAIVDITNLQDMRVIGEVPMPGVTHDLSIDASRRRLFSGGTNALPAGSAPGTVAGEAVFMIDFSDPFRLGVFDEDADGVDDRVLWRAPYPQGVNTLRLDDSRGLLYVGSEKGLDVWAVYDVCCDLVTDMTAEAHERQTGDRASLLAKEKKALQQEITAGLQAAATTCALPLSSIAILEQGSGACLWKANPSQACSDTYQPGLSDHDYEVFFPASISPNVQSCTVAELSQRFLDPATEQPKTITVDDGSSITFEDVTFFPFSREDFESARLNVRPPQSAGGDPTGDLGLGRQQLLLLWLLGGEYIDLPQLSAVSPGRSLDAILQDLKGQTGIPRLEGFEWATLQAFNLAKSKALLRLKGASDSGSSLHAAYVKQLHDAAKAGIRAAFGRLVADPSGNAFATSVTRQSYVSTACLAVNEAVTNPNRWLQKPCTSFEEYAASAIARTLRGSTPLPLFTLQDVFMIHRFYRVKADVERVLSEADADQFIAAIWHFLETSKTVTLPVYEQQVATDPQSALRASNRQAAEQKRVTALKTAKVTLSPRVLNQGFRPADQVQLAMYLSDANGSGQLKKQVRVDLAGGDRQVIDYERNADGSLKLDEENLAIPIFTLGPIDTTVGAGTPHGVSFTIDLPEHKLQEAARENNVGGFFYYVLNVQSPAMPSMPATPFVPLDPSLLEPSPECDASPALRITQRLLRENNEPLEGNVEIALGEQLTLQLIVTNLSGDAQTGVTACSNLTNACYDLGTLAVGETKTKEVPYTAPLTGTYLDGTPTVFSAEGGIVSGSPLRVAAACEQYRITELDKNPNPATSEAMIGGTLYRYYQVVNKRTGAPLANADVALELRGFFGASDGVQRRSYKTDAKGRIYDPQHPAAPDTVPGLGIPVAAPMLTGTTYFASITSVNGVEAACSAPVAFQFQAKDREYSRAYGRGVGLDGSLGLVLTGELAGEAGLELEKEETFFTGAKKLSITASAQLSGKLGLEFSLGKKKGEWKGFNLGSKGEVGVSTTRVSGWSSKYAFEYPLDPAENCAIASITLDGVMAVNPLFVKLLDQVRSQPCGNRLVYLKSTSSIFGREAQAEASFKFSGSKEFFPLPGEKHMGVNFGASGSSGFGIEIGHKHGYDVANQGLDNPTSYTEEYSLKGGLNFSAGLEIGPADPPKSEDDKDDEKTTIAVQLKALKVGVSQNLAEGYSVAFETDYTKPLPPDLYPSKVSIGYNAPKGYGWKRTVAGNEDNLVGGVGRGLSYDIDDPAAVKQVVDGLANLDAIRQANVGAGVFQQIVLGPTLLNEEMQKFRTLLRNINASYTIFESRGAGSELPLGLEGKFLGLELGASLKIKADNKVAYTTEKGVVVNGRSYALETYAKDDYVPDHDPALLNVVKNSWESVVAENAAQFSDVSASISQGGTTRLRSLFTATMDIDGTKEAAPFDANLFSWRFRPLAGPVEEARYMPADTFGPAGNPHYGIGGFHQFSPEGRQLGEPTPLVIDYTDAEVTTLDESSLRIYAWNTEAQDWDLVGGVVDAAANTVTATVNRFRLYTLAPAMPARTISLTATDAGSTGTGETATQRFTVTTAALVTNDGRAVPDGTLFTVRAVAAGTGDVTPYGTVVTPDADSGRANVQVASQNGVLQFEVEYPAPHGVYLPGRIAVYSTIGTAFGDTTAVKQ